MKIYQSTADRHRFENCGATDERIAKVSNRIRLLLLVRTMVVVLLLLVFVYLFHSWVVGALGFSAGRSFCFFYLVMTTRITRATAFFPRSAEAIFQTSRHDFTRDSDWLSELWRG